MKYVLFSAVACFILSAFVFAQSDSSPSGTSAPVKWERYRDSDRGISVMLPKIPTAIVTVGGCSELNTSTYHAYANGAVYTMTIASKGRIASPFCRDVIRFSRDLLLSRIAKLYGKDPTSAEVIAAAEDGRKTDFQGDTVDIFVVPDMERNRWVEMSVNYRKGERPDEKQFVDSLELKSDQGIRIGSGAEATVGDIEPGPDTPAAGSSNTPADDPVIVVAKPKANYTDQARRNREQGVVTVRVTLLKNGSVGNIQAVRELKHGLTEQAIAAAKRIVFLPKRTNGTPVTVVKLIEYSFNIY
jgi:TonB family protein